MAISVALSIEIPPTFPAQIKFPKESNFKINASKSPLELK